MTQPGTDSENSTAKLNSLPPNLTERERLAELLRRRAEMKQLRPSSFAQQRFWLIDQLTDGNDSYNIPAVVRLRGTLSLDHLRAALNCIVARHECVRSVYHRAEDGNVLQRIVSKLQLNIPLIDLSDASEYEVKRQLNQLATEGFSLTQGPLLRCAILKRSATEHLLSLTMHHSIADGWSIANLTHELAIAYQSLVSGNLNPPLPPLSIQYSDYASWQKEQVSSGAYEEQAKYWQQQFENLPEPLELPLDTIRPSGAMRGGRERLHLSVQLTERLKNLGRAHGATLYMVLLASWSSFLGRLSNQRDVIIGSPVAGRSRPELEPLIGCFVNTLALRVRWEAETSFEGLIEQVRDTALDGFAHQEYPFDRVIEGLKLPRDLGSNPLFRVMFALQNISQPQLKLGDLEVELIETENESAKFDLTMAMFEQADGSLVGSWEYAADMFSRETIAYWQKLYVRWLEEITRDCERSLSRIEWLWPEERARLESWSRGEQVEFDRQTTVDKKFWEQACQYPERMAVESSKEQLSYAELAERAEQAARRLQEAGVKSGDTVAIQSERSVEWIVGLLGILRAGGVYLPLDPKGNPEANRFIIEDSQPRLLLHGSGELSAELSVPVVRLSEACGAQSGKIASESSSVEGLERGRVEHDRGGADAVYLMYTSGSTGRPKGSWVRHEGVVNLVNSCTYLDVNGLTAQGQLRVSHLSNPAFDATTFEVWIALLNGGTLIVIDAETSLDPEELGKTFERHEVRVAIMTTAHVNFLGQTHPGIYTGLHFLMAGGEVLQSIVCKKIHAACPNLQLVNGYGPTEATCISSAHRTSAADQEEPRVPIGKPIQNVFAYVVDTNLNLQPAGVAGELILGGPGVGNGYLNRPDDDKRFFQSASFPGLRLYRTGDLVRWNRKGQLDFLGRIDRQVKLRGFRIELTAIEVACLQVEGVDEAIVVLRKEGHIECLVCYLGIKAQETQKLVAKVREHLSQQLAPQMVPGIYVPLAALPKTNNGKVDVKNLPAPTDEQRGVSDAPLETATQITLAAIWKEILNIQHVGLHDRFFDIGGHSLATIRLVSQISQTWSIDLPLKTVWRKSSLGELASEIDRLVDSGVKSQPIVARRQTIAPLALPQESIWKADLLTSQSGLYNVGLGCKLSGNVEPSVLHAALQRIVQRHSALRTRILYQDGIPVQVITDDDGIDWHYDDLRELSEQDRSARLAETAHRVQRLPFNLARDRQLRASLSHIDEHSFQLNLGFHHLHVDGWSLDIFFQELNRHYSLLRSGSESALPALAIQYSDYASWQKEQVSSGAYAEQAKYWQQQFENLPEPLELPLDTIRPSGAMRGGREKLHLSVQLTERLKNLGRAHGATLYMVLLASWSSFLGRLSNQRDVIIGSPVAGRSRPELEPLIGCFVNTLALRVRWEAETSFEGLIEQVRDTALDGFAHQEYPFDRVIEGLKLPRDLGSNPLFRVMFALQNISQPQLKLGDLEVELIETENESAKFDLTMAMFEQADGSLVGSWEYAADMFSRETIAYWQKLYVRWLEEITRDCERSLSRIEWLWPEERARLESWSRGEQVEFDRQTTVDKKFWEQASQYPERMAVESSKEQLSYAELAERAEQAARRLQEAGVKSGDTVAIQSERSVEWIVGLLGILRAGGVYLPLDPKGNPEANRFIIEDSQPRLLLHGSGELSAELSVPVVRLSEACGAQSGKIASESSSVEGLERGRVEHDRGGADAVYLMYTSGSTGRPKGSWVKHEGVMNMVSSCKYLDVDGLKAQGQLRVSHLSNPAFDATTFEVWVTLLNGGTLIVIDAETSLDPEELGKTFERCQVRVAFMTTSFFNQYALKHVETFRPLRHLFFGGEAANSECVRLVRTHFPALKLSNMYGPTECTTFTTYFELPDVWDWSYGPTLPLGRPLHNTQVMILDEDSQVQPPGVYGELCVVGPGVSSGYLNNPALTESQFVEHDRANGVKRYKTGDIVRWTQAGHLEFKGRRDGQIKLRGYRIEKAAIELAIKEVAPIKDVFVTVEKSESGDRLIAFVLTESAISDAALVKGRSALRQLLPDYMIPSRLISLSTWPLNANGKVDSKALLKLAAQPAQESTREVVIKHEAYDSLATSLKGMWLECLGIADVGTNDNFFEVGGHSLLAMQLASKLSLQLGRTISPMTIFSYPTIDELARHLSTETETVIAPTAAPRANVVSTPNLAKSNPLQETAFLQFSETPLEQLIEQNEIAPVDSIAIGYLPESLRASLIAAGAEGILEMITEPIVSSVTETAFGRVAAIIVPIWGVELYERSEKLAHSVFEACKLGQRLGGTHASLTGLVPSATDGGRKVTQLLEQDNVDFKITTGHATTASAVLLNTLNLCRESSRDLSQERVAFLGLGSIGSSTLRLMIQQGFWPAALMLVDVPSKHAFLLQLEEELRALGYQGPVSILTTTGDAPAEVYESSLIIGATNFPNTLKVNLLRPGTLVVDDSGPHCFDVVEGVARMNERADVLLIEGGLLQMPKPSRQLRYMPAILSTMLPGAGFQHSLSHDPWSMTGCILAGLISTQRFQRTCVLGTPNLSQLAEHFQFLRDNGLQGAPLHCQGTDLSQRTLSLFRHQQSLKLWNANT